LEVNYNFFFLSPLIGGIISGQLVDRHTLVSVAIQKDKGSFHLGVCNSVRTDQVQECNRVCMVV